MVWWNRIRYGSDESTPCRKHLPEADLTRLQTAERNGLRLAVLCRSTALAILLGLGLLIVDFGATRVVVISILGLFAFTGFAFLAVIGTRFERRWMKYALFGVDYLAIGALFAFAPLSLGGDVPQIQAFRNNGVHYWFLPMALATVSLSPGLVLWCGVAAAGSLWAAFGIVVAQMDRTVSWGDLPNATDVDTYMAVVLDPDFIAMGNRITESVFLVVIALILALAVARARRVLLAQFRAEADRAFIAGLFGEYVPEQVANKLIADPQSLEPQTRRATVVCLDIAGFTSLAQKSTPEEVIGLLNDFFTDASEVVSGINGVVVEFSGDGFIATFNAPLPDPEHEQKAIEAAQRLLAMVAEKRYRGHALSIRLGVATGEFASGSVGGGGRRCFTVHGDVVNLAARLQDLAKQKGVTVLMDANTAQALPEDNVVSLGETEAIRGRSGAVAVYGIDRSAPEAA